MSLRTTFNVVVDSETGKEVPFNLIDLKYKKKRGLDIDMLRQTNSDVPELFIENMDTIEFRLKECIESGGTHLDISHMDLKILPKIPSTVQYLFCNDNKLTSIDTLHRLPLKTLDCSANRIDEIQVLPKSLTELCCRNNKLVDLHATEMCIKLKIIDCSHNEIIELPAINTLEIIECENNQIRILPSIHQLRKLNCKDNKIHSLGVYPKLEELECTNNRLTQITGYPRLLSLFCENNKIINLDRFKKITVIHCQGNHITHLPYFDNLVELLCDYDKVKKLHKKYNIQIHNVYEPNLMYLQFDVSKQE